MLVVPVLVRRGFLCPRHRELNRSFAVEQTYKTLTLLTPRQKVLTVPWTPIGATGRPVPPGQYVGPSA